MNRRLGCACAWLMLLSASPTFAAEHDLDGDGRDDVVFRNSRTGADVAWRSGDPANASTLYPVSNMRWAIIGAGDFDGDGRADLLWRQRSTNAHVIWFGGNAGTQRSLAPPMSTLRVVGIGDFDADGRSDLLWRDSALGGMWVWRGADPATQNALGVLAANGYVAATGDLDGDGGDDIVWRTRAGATSVWANGLRTAARTLPTLIDERWQIAAVGDFDGDARDDLLWRHTATGRNVLWRGGNSGAVTLLPTVADAMWQVAAVGDYDGDGRDDLFWRHFTQARHVIWPGANAAGTQPVRQSASLEWSVEPYEAQPSMPVLQFVESKFVEGNSGSRQALLRARLSHPAVDVVHAGLTLDDWFDEASAPFFADIELDFTTAFGLETLFEFAPGETTVDIPIQVIGDTTPEINERLWTIAYEVSGAQLAKYYPDIRIHNDDQNTAWIEGNGGMVEGNTGIGTMTFMVKLSRPSTVPVTCDVSTLTANTQATPGVDYQERAAQLRFAPGTNAVAFNVPIMGDTTSEGAEALWVGISSCTGVLVVAAETLGYIFDDDTP